MPTEFQREAPIKRHLSRENTTPSQKNAGLKNSLFLQDQLQYGISFPFVVCARYFISYWCGCFIALLPGTHQVQGGLRKNEHL